jgi:hypothetical protein
MAPFARAGRIHETRSAGVLGARGEAAGLPARSRSGEGRPAGRGRFDRPVHEVWPLTNLRLSSCAVGLLLNVNTNLLQDGPRRFVNTFCTLFRAVRETSVPKR